MLQIIDTSIYKKFVPTIDTTYMMKNKSYFFLKHYMEDICIIRATRKNETSIGISYYLDSGDKGDVISESVEEVVLKYLANNFNTEKHLLYDFTTHEIIYDIEENKELVPLYVSFNPLINKKVLAVQKAFKIVNGVSIDEKTIVCVDTKPAIQGLINFITTTETLISPKNYDANDFGSSVVYFVGNMLAGFPIELFSYVDLQEYDRSYKKEPGVDSTYLTRLTKLMTFIKKQNNKSNKNNNVKLLEDGEDKKDTIDNNKYYLSVLLTDRKLPFVAVPRMVEIDILKDELKDMKSLVLTRTGLVFYSDSSELFKGTKVIDRLKEIKEILGIDDIGIRLWSDSL